MNFFLSVNNKIKVSLICFVLLIISGSSTAAIIHISGFVHPTEAPDIKDNQFILVDFWATWCGPCIQAMDHLGRLRQAGGENLVVIGLSNEPYDVVKRFFNKREPQTYIAVDSDNRTFSGFNITSLPSAALIAPNGEIIWQGKPTHLSELELQKLMSVKYKAMPVSEKISVKQTEQPTLKEDLWTHKEVNRNNIRLSYDGLLTDFGFSISISDTITTISGKTSDIISALMNVPKARLHLNAEARYGTATFNTTMTNNNRPLLLSLFLEAQDLRYSPVDHQADVSELVVEDSTLLWSNEVYQYSDNGTPVYIIDEGNLQADNYSLPALVDLLTDMIHINFYYQGLCTKTYDWNLDISNVQNLEKQLISEYGIRLKIVNVRLTDFVFSR